MVRRKQTRRQISQEQEREIEANYFAMCLLLPEDLVRAEVERLAPQGFDIDDDPAIVEMTKLFRVSLQLMVIRLCQLGYFKMLGVV